LLQLKVPLAAHETPKGSQHEV